MLPADQSLCVAGGGPLEPDGAAARAAVVLLSDAAGRPILLATTADARAFLRRRLARGGIQADLSAITARADVWLVGSGLEADLAFLRVAREAMPETWEALTERWRAWFIHLDPDAVNPVWRKTNLGDGARESAPGRLIGPMASKDMAGKCGEAIDDLFDLCRFPRELALAPRGTACAYKEMGRCPAPCDGSESMASYRGRVGEALASLRIDRALLSRPFEEAMAQAAARQDFEAAAVAKSRVDRVAALSRPALREARPLDGFRFVAVLGSGRPRWARAWWIDPWRCEPVADLDGARARESVAELEAVVADLAARGEPEGGLDPVLLGIVSRHLLAPAARRRGGFVRVAGEGGERLERGAVTRLLRAAARTERSDVEEFDRATLA